MKKVAITGLSGVIGSHLIPSLPRRIHILDLFHSRPTHRVYPRRFTPIPFDMVSPKECFLSLREAAPDVVIHMAAITHIDKCEEYRKERKNGLAWRVNVDATEAITQYCEESGARLIYLSTECVFDGKKGMYAENAARNPISWYGETKATAEEIILNAQIDAAILRSVVAFDPYHQTKTIYGQFAHKLLSGEKLSVVDDLYFMPTYIDDITHVLSSLVFSEHIGIFHVCSPEKMTPYDFAILVAKKIGVSSSQVEPVHSIDFFGKRKASRRLQNSTLQTKSTKKTLGISGRSVESILL